MSAVEEGVVKPVGLSVGGGQVGGANGVVSHSGAESTTTRAGSDPLGRLNPVAEMERVRDAADLRALASEFTRGNRRTDFVGDEWVQVESNAATDLADVLERAARAIEAQW